MFVRVESTRVNVVSFGRGEPILVGVGGWIGSWELWAQPFELLSRRFRTVAYDHAGAGATLASAESLSFESQVEGLFGVLDALDIGTCVLLGESNGGTVALAAALQSPQRFSQLVLVATPHSGLDTEETRGFVEGLRRDYERTLLRFVDLCLPEHDDAHLRRWLTQILGRAEPEAAIRLVETMYELDLRARLPELHVPTLVIHGAQDPLPASRLLTAHQTVELLPDASLHVIADAGHVPTLTHADEVAQAIEAFLDGRATPPPN